MPQSRLQPCLTRLRWSGGVTAGQAEIHSQGDLTTITQSSQNAAINWQSFSVAPQETVQFKQPNSDSITLNRVTGNEASDIQGKIKANGHIFISNPNGVLIGNNAQINVGGLVATTQKISDEDFMANRFNFTGEGKGVVENRGHIQVPKGGVVALVAPIVKNSGKITALQANTLLASAEHFSITLPSNNKFSYQITKGTLQGLVDNGGAILADGGYVVLTAKGLSAVKKSVINHSGTIQANTVSNKNGKIELLGDLDNSQLNVAGKLIAEAPNSGDGGFIETSAAKVKIDDHVNVSTKSTKGSSGTWLIDPNDFVIGGKKADMTANTLSRQLDNGNVTVKSTNGKATGKGDIIINKQVDWNKNRLTLSAQNDILINKTLNGTGTASLVMEYGLATSDGGESDFYLQKYVPLTERTAAINLPEGKNLRVRKGSEGEFTTFDVIHKMPEILEDGTNAEFPSKHIALGQDIDLSYTKTLNNPKFGGWKDNTNFERSGNFWGLGHKVTDLYINSDVKGIKGFLTYTSSNIRDIGVTGEIIGTQDDLTIGGLIGSTNNKFIKNSYTDISITGGSTDIGGLVGKVSGNTTNKTQIINSSSKGHIKITNYKGTNIGGLLGVTSNTEIVDSNAKVDIIGNVYSSSYVGGLIGNSSSNSIINSYAISDISLTNDVKDVGGLIGSMFDSVISHSYAKGKLKLPNATSNYTNNEGIGGLVGSVWAGNISNSYANLDINAPKAIVGGLIGSASYWGHEDSTVSIKNSYSLGNIIGSTVGGLIGYIDTSGNILDSYSNSNIEGTTSYWQDGVGGIIGKLKYANIQLQNVYSVGEITGKQNVAGLVVKDSGNITVNNSYTLGDVKGEENVKRFIASSYDEDITTTNSGVLDDDALKDKSSFKNWDFENVWEIKEGQYPTLRNVGVVTPEAPPVVEDVDEPEVEPVKPEVPQPQPEIDHKPKALELLKSAALIRKNMQNKLTILANQGVDADIVSLNNNIANAKREAQAEIEKVTNSQDKLELNLQLEAITLLDDATINAAKQTAAQKRKEAEDKRLEEERKQKEAARLEKERKEKAEAARLEKERKEKAEAARLEKERKEKAESDRLAQEAARIKAEKLKEDQKLKDAARDAYNKAFVTQKQMQARLNNGEISFGKASEQIAREKETARRAIEKVNDASYRSEYLAKLNSIKPLVAVKPVESSKPVQPLDDEEREKLREIENHKKIADYVYDNVVILYNQMKSQFRKGEISLNEANQKIEYAKRQVKVKIREVEDTAYQHKKFEELNKIQLLVADKAVKPPKVEDKPVIKPQPKPNEQVNEFKSNKQQLEKEISNTNKIVSEGNDNKNVGKVILNNLGKNGLKYLAKAPLEDSKLDSLTDVASSVIEGDQLSLDAASIQTISEFTVLPLVEKGVEQFITTLSHKDVIKMLQPLGIGDLGSKMRGGAKPFLMSLNGKLEKAKAANPGAWKEDFIKSIFLNIFKDTLREVVFDAQEGEKPFVDLFIDTSGEVIDTFITTARYGGNAGTFSVVLTQKLAVLSAKQAIKFAVEGMKFSGETQKVLTSKFETLSDAAQAKIDFDFGVKAARGIYQNGLGNNREIAQTFGLNEKQMDGINGRLVDILIAKHSNKPEEAQRKLQALIQDYPGSDRKESWVDRTINVGRSVFSGAKVVVDGVINPVQDVIDSGAGVAASGILNLAGKKQAAQKVGELVENRKVERFERSFQRASQDHSGIHNMSDYIRSAIIGLQLDK